VTPIIYQFDFYNKLKYFFVICNKILFNLERQMKSSLSYKEVLPNTSIRKIVEPMIKNLFSNLDFS